MDQPIPTVTPADVERIVRRDFHSNNFDAVMEILAGYDRPESLRVQVAALKLAGGRMDYLRREIERALRDYRDILAVAEYPAYDRKGLRIYDLPAEEQQKIIEEDWNQYESWFKK